MFGHEEIPYTKIAEIGSSVRAEVGLLLSNGRRLTLSISPAANPLSAEFLRSKNRAERSPVAYVAPCAIRAPRTVSALTKSSALFRIQRHWASSPGRGRRDPRFQLIWARTKS